MNEASVSLPSPKSAPDPRWQKLQWVAWIMGLGMAFNLAWYGFIHFATPWGYPYDTFLFEKGERYSDLTDTVKAARQANPYLYPFSHYLPFAWLCLRSLNGLDATLGTIVGFSLFDGILLVLLAKALQPVVPGPWRCAFLSLLLIVLSYPMLICLDRGNPEIAMAALVAAGLNCFSRSKLFGASLCLALALGFKLYPILLLAVVARRNPRMALIGLLAAGVLFLLSLGCLPLAFGTFDTYFARNMAYYTSCFVYQNYFLNASASPWNAAKLLLIIAVHHHLIAPVDFTPTGSFIRAAYALYSVGMLLLAQVLACFAAFLEKEWMRGAAVLLLFMSMIAPGGGDYRLIYAAIATVLLVLAKSRRPCDTAVLLLLALVEVPKKLVVFGYAGITESGRSDVNSAVLIDPILVLGAIFLLLYSSRRYIDLDWTRLRIRRMIRQLVTARETARFNPSRQERL